MSSSNFFHTSKLLTKKSKILFATFPADGHVNPLTGIAAHLKSLGHDVRWYTAETYREKIEKLDIPFYPLQKALEVTGDNVHDIFPELKKTKSQVAQLSLGIINIFINRGPEYYEDVKAIHKVFPFDLMICDIVFTGIPFVSDLMKIPVIGVGIVPITADSRDLPPAGIGMLPSKSFMGRRKQDFMRWMAKKVLFAKCNKVQKSILDSFGIKSESNSIFELAKEKCKFVLQTGTPGFEYERSDMPDNYRYVGPLLPKAKKAAARWTNEKLSQYKKVVLATQGTVEKDSTKLLVPTLEAFKDTDTLVVIATGGGDTEKLRKEYSAPNVIIEDFIPFADVMPYADLYITNGGMGGVQLGIQNNLPLITAGVHEGKIEICARVGYFNFGINLKTERPTAVQIRKAADEIMANPNYRKNVEALSQEFNRYDPDALCEKYVNEVLGQTGTIRRIPVAASTY